MIRKIKGTKGVPWTITNSEIDFFVQEPPLKGG